MKTFTVTMTKIEGTPFVFPNPDNVGEVVAPLITSKYLNEEHSEVLLRVIQFAHQDIAGAPTLEIKPNAAEQLTAVVNYTTNEGALNDLPNEVWYGEVQISVAQGMNPAANIVTCDAVDGGRPPKTSRGTVVTIQPAGGN